MKLTDPRSDAGGFVTFHQTSFPSLRANRAYRRELSRSLDASDDLVFAKDMRAFASRGGFGLGLGDPRRTITFCAWRTVQAADEFFTQPSGLAADRDWGALLEVTRTRGSHFGVTPLIESDSLDDDEPFAAFTLGSTGWRGLARFMIHGTRLRKPLEASPGLVYATSAGWPTTGNSTFSLWESEAAMVAFAYGSGGGHVQTAHARPPVLTGQLNARMRVLAIDGSLAQIPGISRSARSARWR